MVEKGAWTNICGIVVPDAAYDNITVGSFFPDRASYTHEGTISSFSSSYHFIRRCGGGTRRPTQAASPASAMCHRLDESALKAAAMTCACTRTPLTTW
jgi:hypothetical protein